MRFTSRILQLIAASALLVLALPAGADAFPDKPIRWIVPYPPGGSTDILTRIIGQKMSESFGQSVIIENRGGASGIIGVEAAAKAAPDGYTLLMTASGPHAINPSLFPKLPYDPVRNFAPITLVAKLPMLLLVHPSLPANNLRELIAHIKSRPEPFAFASIGSGTPSHLALELFREMAGVQLTHVPYKGSGPALTALLGGQEAMVLFDSVLSSMSHVKSSRLKAIAVSTAERLPALPDVPTVAESGLPGFDAYTWTAAVAPAGVSADRLAKISAEMMRILQLSDVREKITGQGAIPVGNSPTEFGAFAQAEIEKWGKLIRSANIRAE